MSFVQNFTDIDDKILKRASEENSSMTAVSERNIDAFHAIYNIHIDRIKYDAFAFRLFLRLVAAKRAMIKIKHNNRKIGCNRCIVNILYIVKYVYINLLNLQVVHFTHYTIHNTQL